ncbi:hypothetical protein Pint_15714 [Pistacia integerrima]|uniref:Uncharacterized protein n=1 Tax=Pistacia integerrima TaxID=434235 RepID=A0ACC0ZCK9_9ROSI|nr:hypothetical protein Pint_15714 [Pistacia integerrima]
MNDHRLCQVKKFGSFQGNCLLFKDEIEILRPDLVPSETVSVICVNGEVLPQVHQSWKPSQDKGGALMVVGWQCCRMVKVVMIDLGPPHLRKFRDVGEENPWSAKALKEKKVDDDNFKACSAKMGKDLIGLDHERVECIGPGDQRNFGLSEQMGSKVIGGFICTEEARPTLKKGVSSGVEGSLKMDGSWLFQNKPILLQKWQPGMELSKESSRFIPVWVKFYDIPLELWSAIRLSYIASTVGKLLGMDRITEDSCGYSLRRMRFARILVEVDTARWNFNGDPRSVGGVEYLGIQMSCALINRGLWRRGMNHEEDKWMEADSEDKGKSDIESDSTPMVRFLIEGCWNIRGLNQPIKQEEVKVFTKEKRLALCSLLETCVAIVSTNCIFNHVFRNWNWISNTDHGSRGCRVVVGWNILVYYVRVVGMTEQVVNCVVRELRNGNEFFASFVYAMNDLVGRRELWDNLCNHKCVVENSLWIVMGDFNATLYLNESLGGSNVITTAMKEFRDCVDELAIEDNNQVGIMYTWNGKPHGDSGVLKNLDRVMGNVPFATKFLVLMRSSGPMELVTIVLRLPCSLIFV